MHQLIITVMAIALSSILVMVGVNYIPWGFKERDQMTEVIQTSLPKLENAYDIVTAANSGTPPASQATADGGFANNFLPTLKFTPATLPGYSLRYGTYAGTNTRYTGLNYFCMTTSRITTEIAYKALLKAKNQFSPDQYFVSTSCGDTSNASGYHNNTSYQLTFFVAYVPNP